MLALGSYILRKHHMYPIFSSLHHGSDPDLRCQPTGRYAFCWSGTLLGLYLLLEWEALSTGSGVGPVENLWLIMFCATFASISQITWANNMFIVPNIYIYIIMHSFIHSFLPSFIHSLTHSPTHPLTHSVTQSPSHSVTQSLSHSVTQSLSHSVT